MRFIKKIENAHNNIDSLINMDFLRNKLTELSGLQNKHQFGSEGQGFFKNNIIDALVDSRLKNENIEDILKFGLGGRFGRDNKWSSTFQGGKGWGNLNIGRKF